LFFGHFWIDFVDIEIKLGMIVYNNELHIKLSFVVIGQYLMELWALGLRIFMKISVFRRFLAHLS
jgi:small basic protein